MKNNASYGLSFEGTLLITFIVLKLIKVINWSWLWVFSPIWIPLCLILLIYFILLIYDTNRAFIP